MGQPIGAAVSRQVGARYADGSGGGKGDRSGVDFGRDPANRSVPKGGGGGTCGEALKDSRSVMIAHRHSAYVVFRSFFIPRG